MRPIVGSALGVLAFRTGAVREAEVVHGLLVRGKRDHV
jgi:hypothetical protein